MARTIDTSDFEIEDWMNLDCQRDMAEEAKARWAQLFNEIFPVGIQVNPDFPEVPVMLRRRKGGLPIDVFATQYGFDYTEDFYQHVCSLYAEMKKWQGVRFPQPPRHEDNKLQALLDQVNEAKRAYRAACKAADVEPQAV